MNRILISGGWGYGNLGDDAILNSTIKLVRKKFPAAELVVSSYNCEETQGRISRDENITIIPSVHRLFTGNLSSKRLRVLNGSEVSDLREGIDRGLGQKIRSKFTTLNNIWEEQVSYRKYLVLIENTSSLTENLNYTSFDLFILAGGGYFLGEWLDNLYSRVLELNIAKQHNIPILIIGQTIGPFLTAKAKKIAVKGLQAADLVSVRDQESVDELQTLGIKSRLIPDTALSEIDYVHEKQPTLTLVIGGTGFNAVKSAVLTKSVTEASRLLGLSIKVVITRLWLSDLISAQKIIRILEKENPDVSMIVPKTFDELKNVLGSSSVMVSQNLHGLILGWRSGVPVISLNGGRKFVAFMKQSNQSHRLHPIEELSAKELTESILEAGKQPGRSFTLQEEMAVKIREGFDDCLDELVQTIQGSN